MFFKLSLLFLCFCGVVLGDLRKSERSALLFLQTSTDIVYDYNQTSLNCPTSYAFRGVDDQSVAFDCDSDGFVTRLEILNIQKYIKLISTPQYNDGLDQFTLLPRLVSARFSGNIYGSM